MPANIEPNPIDTHYTDIGTGAPLVLIHALGLSTGMWSLQVPVLGQRCRVIRYDVRGHGLTPYIGKPLSIWTLADDLSELLNHLSLERASIIGISMGGVIAQAFAISHPESVSALGLVSTISVYNDTARANLLERAHTVEKEGMEPMVAPAIDRWFTASFKERAKSEVVPAGNLANGVQAGTEAFEASVIAAIGKMIATTDPRGYAAACRALAEIDLSNDLGKISCPTLIMSGEQDPGISRESQEVLRSGIKDSTEIRVPDCSHLIPLERQADFTSHLLNFLTWSSSL